MVYLRFMSIDRPIYGWMDGSTFDGRTDRRSHLLLRQRMAEESPLRAAVALILFLIALFAVSYFSVIYAAEPVPPESRANWNCLYRILESYTHCRLSGSIVCVFALNLLEMDHWWHQIHSTGVEPLGRQKRKNTNSQLSNYFVGQTECGRTAEEQKIQSNGIERRTRAFSLFFKNKQAKMGALQIHWLPAVSLISSPLFDSGFFMCFKSKAEDSPSVKLIAWNSVGSICVECAVVHYESLVYRSAMTL